MHMGMYRQVTMDSLDRRMCTAMQDLLAMLGSALDMFFLQWFREGRHYLLGERAQACMPSTLSYVLPTPCIACDPRWRTLTIVLMTKQ